MKKSKMSEKVYKAYIARITKLLTLLIFQLVTELVKLEQWFLML